MKKVLVLGGTRFFGKRLVQKLIDHGDDVSVATRGKTELDFKGKVHHITVDRFNRRSMEQAFHEGEWDVVYDQICFSPNDALDACEVFAGKTRKYVYTSTLSVYDFNDKPEKTEMDFDPYSYELKWGRKEQFEYGEGKRLAEAVFFQRATFPVVAVRPPVVFGEDDYTERLHYYIRKVMKGEKIAIDHLDAKVSFVESDDLAEFLLWVGLNDLNGPINTSAPDQITLGQMIKLIEKKVGSNAVVEPPKSKQERSPLNFPSSIFQNVSLAKTNGYTFRPLVDWFEPLISTITDQEKSK